MNDLIRAALGDIGDHLTPPVPDLVEFDHRVRAVRRRRTARRTALGAVVAASVGVAVMVAPGVLSAGEREPGGFAATATPAPGEAGPVWFVQASELRAEVDRKVVRTGRPADQVLGSTATGVWYIDDRSRVRWVDVARGSDGLSTTPAPGPSGTRTAPVADAVQSAVLSTDARMLSWVTRDDELVAYSVSDRTELFHRQLGSGDRLFGVSEAGVLVEQDGTLRLLGQDRDIDVTGADFIDASITGRTVTVRSYPRGTPVSTQVFAVDGERAELVRSVSGHAWMAPDETSLLTLPGEDDPAPATVTRGGGPAAELTGLDLTAHALEFTERGTVVLAAVGGEGDSLVECVLATAACTTLVADGVPNGPLIRLVQHTL